MKLELRNTSEDDLDILFEIQKDEQAVYLAAFTNKDPSNKELYLEKWRKLLKDKTIHSQTIFLHDEIVGSVCKYLIKNEPELTYGIKRSYWGQGLATEAVRLFLTIEKSRPLNARAAFDNIGSLRVLEKNGFNRIGTDIGYANARQKEILEFIYKLDA